jgi:hypothetical protein
VRVEELQLVQPQRVVRAAVVMAQARDPLRRMRPLRVVGGEVGEGEENPARSTVALRLLHLLQRLDRCDARGIPRAGGEDREHPVERRVDALGRAARAAM